MVEKLKQVLAAVRRRPPSDFICQMLLGPALVGVWCGADQIILHTLGGSTWLHRWFLERFPEWDSLSVLGVAVSLLAVSLTIVVVAYSASEIDRSVVRAVILENPRTTGMFGLFFGLTLTDGFFALVDLKAPAIAWGQVAGLLIALILILRYFRWFSRVLHLQQIGLVAIDLPLSSTERADLVLRLLRDAAVRGKREDIEAVLNQFRELVVTELPHFVADFRSEVDFRTQSMAALTRMAADAVRTRDDILLEGLVNLVLALAGTPGLDWAWLDPMVEWFVAWHQEFLQHPEVGPHANRHFNKIHFYLGILLDTWVHRDAAGR